MMKLSKKLQALTLAAAFAVMPLSAYAAQSEGTIELKTMGSLLFGGTPAAAPSTATTATRSIMCRRMHAPTP